MDLQEQQKYKVVIERNVDELRRHLAQPDETTAPVSLDNPIGRLTRIDAMQAQQMAIELRRRQEGQLARLEKALRLIEEGEYGACGRCGEDIAQRRLEIYPDARLCVDCAEKLEKRS
ncbi:MAG TPA: TraR/DksA family transcriptional regulator [Pyrinomonadaceae bacterium]|nr:TraR/DksA family transcriptional regulator [Pyrinomonadaceae bacterium]